ncbi:unnamed protein product [Coffea canephora]|uniref:Uncharacterized protein n=1 Tax=Coffea canephora TaxID=49390 RepID=A0A068VDF1_COFCA|nr:unnamed protein product [Coffea canephora]
MAGAVLCTLNIRHDSAMVLTLLKHSGAKVIFVDYHIAKGALGILLKTSSKMPKLVVIPDQGNSSSRVSDMYFNKDNLEYESFLASGRPDFEVIRPHDEWDPISLNYTSGTTSSPKGVVYNHRGAYLNSLAAVLLNEMPSMPVCLSTAPMFLTWAAVAQGGTNVCLRNVTAKGIFECIAKHQVRHMGGAPTVLNMIINAPSVDRRLLPGKVIVMASAASPPPHVLFKMEELEQFALGNQSGIHYHVMHRPRSRLVKDEIIKYCRDRLSHYMAPRTVVFEELPKTSTGKIQKIVLRQKAKDMGSLSRARRL